MSNLFRDTKYWLLVVLVLYSLYAATLNGITSSHINADNSLVLLAKQFSKGHISLEPTTHMPLGDMSKFGGKYYLYFGPFPSLLLMPIVMIFGTNISQVILGIASLILAGISVYSIAMSLKFTRVDAGWVTLFYLCSTVLLSSSIITITAYQVEALGSTLVLLSLREYVSKRRPLLIGMFLGFALLTRAVLILALLFYALEYVQKRLTIRQIVTLCIPVMVCGMVFGGYNYLRFHSLFETGYAYNITLNSYPLSENLKYGYMSLTHVPTNLYSLFLMPPQPVTKDVHGFVLTFPYLKVNPWGLAIWYTSPLFLVLLYAWKKGIYSRSATITVCGMAVPLLLYYSIGFAQFGYRYALDFLPFLLLVLLHSLAPKLSMKDIVLIVIGILFNAWYMMSLWNLYPLFGLHT